MCKIMDDIYKEGKAVGLEEGIEYGRLEGARNIALQMLREGTVAVEKIARYCQLSIAEVEKLRIEAGH